MGIKTRLKKKQLPKKYQQYNLIETIDGNTQSVYMLNDDYVLKLYENTPLQTIKNEQQLLKKLYNLKVPQLLDIFKIESNYIAIFSQIKGDSIKKPNLDHIRQIGLFLKQFHNISKDLISTNKQIYNKNNLENLIIKTNNKILKNYFYDITIDLKIDGVIHGDMFCDNVKFLDDKLSGVYDFTEACGGDFIFDLAVVAISWCYDIDILDHKKLDTLLLSYDLNISYSKFKNYINYALIYYATIRDLDHRDYQDLLNKLHLIL
jgi:homoserine kinase type II